MDGLRKINQRRRAFNAQPMKASRRKFQYGGFVDDTGTQNSEPIEGGRPAEEGDLTVDRPRSSLNESTGSSMLPRFQGGGRIPPGKGDRQHPAGKALGKQGLRVGGLVDDPSTRMVSASGAPTGAVPVGTAPVGAPLAKAVPARPNVPLGGQMQSTRTMPGGFRIGDTGLGQRRFTGDNPLWTRPQPGELADYVGSRSGLRFKKGGKAGLKGYQAGGMVWPPIPEEVLTRNAMGPRLTTAQGTVTPAPPGSSGTMMPRGGGIPVSSGTVMPPGGGTSYTMAPQTPTTAAPAATAPAAGAEAAKTASRLSRLGQGAKTLAGRGGAAGLAYLGLRTAHQATTEGTTPTDVRVGHELVDKNLPQYLPGPLGTAARIASQVAPGSPVDEARRALSGAQVGAARRLVNIAGGHLGAPEAGDIAVGAGADVAAGRDVGTTQFEPRPGADALRPTPQSYETDAEAAARGAQVQQGQRAEGLRAFGMTPESTVDTSLGKIAPGVTKYRDPKTGKTLYANTLEDVRGIPPTEEQRKYATDLAAAESKKLSGLVQARAMSGHPADLEVARQLAVTPEDRQTVAYAENMAGLRARASDPGSAGRAARLELKGKMAAEAEGLRGQRALQAAMINRVPTPLELENLSLSQRTAARADTAEARAAEEERRKAGTKVVEDAITNRFGEDKIGASDFYKSLQTTAPLLKGVGGDISKLNPTGLSLLFQLYDLKRNTQPGMVGRLFGASPGSQNLLDYLPKDTSASFWQTMIETPQGRMTLGQAAQGRKDLKDFIARTLAQGID